MQTVICKAVNLNQLIQEPAELRMLVIHSPYSLNLSHIAQCHRLIKLDLSDNKLQTMPPLSPLKHLKILHLHQNFLCLEQIKHLFKPKSQLRTKLLLITFWDNPVPEVKARHWLATKTNLKVINRQVVGLQERLPWVTKGHVSRQVIYPIIAEQLTKNLQSERAYQKLLNQQVCIINRLHDYKHPVLTIQKHVRAFLVRKSRKKKNRQHLSFSNNKTLSLLFQNWRRLTIASKAIRSLLVVRQKAEVLLPLKQYHEFKAKQQVHRYVQHLRLKIAQKKQNNKGLYRIYRLLSSYQFLVQQMAEIHHFNSYPVLYFRKEILRPIQQLLQMAAQRLSMTREQIMTACFLQQQPKLLCFRYGPFPSLTNSPKTLAKYLALENTYVTEVRSNKGNEQFLVHFHNIVTVKKISTVHSTNYIDPNTIIKASLKVNKCSERYRCLYSMHFRNKDLGLLFLRFMCRFNLCNIKLDFGKKQSVPFILLFKGSARIISAAVKIQKNWRAYHVRRQIPCPFSQIQRQRAARKIQHFFKSLPTLHWIHFKEISRSKLMSINNNLLYLKKSSYLQLASYVHKKTAMPHKEFKLRCDSLGQIRGEWSAASLQQYTYLIPSWLQRPRSTESRTTTSKQLDLYYLLHYGSKVKEVEVAECTYYSFAFISPIQARIRAFLYALSTYQPYSSSVNFLLTTNDIKTIKSSLQNKMIIRHAIKDRPIILQSEDAMAKELSTSMEQYSFPLTYFCKSALTVCKYTTTLLIHLPHKELLPIQNSSNQSKYLLLTEGIEKQPRKHSESSKHQLILKEIDISASSASCQPRQRSSMVKKQNFLNTTKKTNRDAAVQSRVRCLTQPQQNEIEIISLPHKSIPAKGEYQSAQAQKITKKRQRERYIDRSAERSQVRFEEQHIKNCNLIVKNLARIRARTEEDEQAIERRRSTINKKYKREDAALKINVLRKQRVQQKIYRLTQGQLYTMQPHKNPPSRPPKSLPRKKIPGSVHAVIAEDLYAVALH